MSNSNIILIPIYKESLKDSEVVSLKQALKVFQKQEIIFFGPETLDCEIYRELCQKGYSRDFTFHKFPDEFFSDLLAYNKLMLSPSFYQEFAEHDFMLLYQLDSYVFEDQLDMWADKGFDYIGAPWFKGFNTSTPNSAMFSFAGNGGFSLRNISKTKQLLESMTKKVDHWYFWSTFVHVGYRYKLKQLKHWFSYATKSAMNLVEELEIYEDIVMARLGPVWNKNYKVALPTDAMKFSFDMHPQVLYKLNGSQLPFGCHAWDKSNEFWKDYIK